jgi:uncharacterized protein YndB with AHSA1/START domain
MPAVSTDRIEKQILLRAPRTRVWRALTDLEQFQQWFGAKLDAPFAPGVRSRGHVTEKGWEHVQMEITVERMEPEHTLTYRWLPFAIDPKRDYSREHRTLVEFSLEEVDGGTRLTVVESGLDLVPADRRAEAFKMHEGGWEGQLKNIAKYVGQ